MSTGIKVRLLAFLVLSAVGIVYITASYLGFIDKALGRGVDVHATLPRSSGLFVGSEVTYRGLKVGKVDAMHVTDDGVRLDLALEEGTRIPLDSPMYVHNLSAVGEQYLDFEPLEDSGTYAEDGDTLEGGPESLPVDEDDLLDPARRARRLGGQARAEDRHRRARGRCSTTPGSRCSG